MRKNFKRGLIVVLAFMMVLGMLPATAFAETEKTIGTDESLVIPNFFGMVLLNNDDCKEFESFAGLNLEIQVTNKMHPEKNFAVPLAYDEEMESYYVEEYLDQPVVFGIIDEILVNQKAALEELGLDDESLENMTEDEFFELDFEALSKTFLEKTFQGYIVQVNGLGKDSHFKAEFYDGSVETGADVIAAFESQLLSMTPEGGFAEEEAPANFTELMDYAVKIDSEGRYESYEEMLQDTDFFTDDEIEFLIAVNTEADALLEAARSGTYPNQLTAVMNLICDCPTMVSYDVYHLYLAEIDGKLVEIDCLDEWDLHDDEFYLEGCAGDTVYGKDYIREVYEGENKDYAGKTFTYAGSYNEEALWLEDDVTVDFSAYALDSYVLSEDYEFDGFVLRYILEEPLELELKAEISYTAESGEDFVITGNGAYKDFQDLLVDGKSVDKEFYTVEEGSTIVTLKAEYLDALDLGEHAVQMVWTTGMAELKFFIAEKPAVPEEDNEKEIILQPESKDHEEPAKTEPVKTEPVKKVVAPQTGDYTPVGLYVVLLLTAVCVIVVLLILKKRKDK